MSIRALGLAVAAAKLKVCVQTGYCQEQLDGKKVRGADIYKHGTVPCTMLMKGLTKPDGGLSDSSILPEAIEIPGSDDVSAMTATTFKWEVEPVQEGGNATNSSNSTAGNATETRMLRGRAVEAENTTEGDVFEHTYVVRFLNVGELMANVEEGGGPTAEELWADTCSGLAARVIFKVQIDGHWATKYLWTSYCDPDTDQATMSAKVESPTRSAPRASLGFAYSFVEADIEQDEFEPNVCTGFADGSLDAYASVLKGPELFNGKTLADLY